MIAGCSKQDSSLTQNEGDSLKKGKPNKPDCVVNWDANTDFESLPFTHTLIAGQNEEVGTVTVSLNGEEVCVDYNLTEGGWMLTESHVFIGSLTEFNEVFSGGCNPAFGHFPYAATIDEGGQTASGCFDAPEGKFIVSVHGVVEGNCGADLAALEESLPLQRGAQPTYWFEGDPKPPGVQPSFFWPMTVSDCPEGLGPNWLDGAYDGWCMDPEEDIVDWLCHTVNVYSSYDENIPQIGNVNMAQLPLINWVINQHWVGQTYDSDNAANGTTFTYGDVTQAIWWLLEFVEEPGLFPPDGWPDNYDGPYDMLRVGTIVADAADHYDYVPDCGELVVIVLDPVVSTTQPTFIYVPMPCGNCGDETAIMEGDNEYPGSRWGWYQWVNAIEF